MNEVTRLLPIWKKYSSPWRSVEIIHLRPSEDVSKIAQSDYNTMPVILRMLLNILGGSKSFG